MHRTPRATCNFPLDTFFFCRCEPFTLSWTASVCPWSLQGVVFSPLPPGTPLPFSFPLVFHFYVWKPVIDGSSKALFGILMDIPFLVTGPCPTGFFFRGPFLPNGVSHFRHSSPLETCLYSGALAPDSVAGSDTHRVFQFSALCDSCFVSSSLFFDSRLALCLRQPSPSLWCAPSP